MAILPDSRTTVTLRPYRPADRPAVLAIFASNTPEFFAESERGDVEVFLDAAERELCLVAIDGETIVGFGGAYCRTPQDGGLAWGMVHRAWHRQGVGRRLLDARIADLWSRGVTRITVHTSQHSAGFFASARFTVVESVADGFAPGIDHVTMRLERA